MRERWHPDEYLEALRLQMTPQYRFQAHNEAEWSEWQAALRTQLIKDLGGFPDKAEHMEALVIESSREDGYVRQRVEIATASGLVMPVYVLIPERRSGRAPAVVACHGHGFGSKDLVGLDEEGECKTEPGYQKHFAVELVRRGFVTIVPELLGFGDRRLRQESAARSSCHTLSTSLLHMGRTLAGYRIFETMCAIDYAIGRSEIDPERIGCMGISGGGLVASFVTAIDERVKTAVVSGYVNTFKDSILAIHHCVDNYVPGLGRHAEMPDIISLIAPRALLIETGTKDHFFPVDATVSAYEDIMRAYRLLGAEDKLALDRFEGIHEINGVQAYDWLLQWLG